MTARKPPEHPGKRHQLRVTMAKQQGGRCYYCDRPMLLDFAARIRLYHARAATFDHNEPIALGGRKSLRHNTVIACRACNTERGHTPFADFCALKRGNAPSWT